MALYEISSEDSEFIELVFDNLIRQKMSQAEDLLKYLQMCSRDYALGDAVKDMDNRFLEAHRDGLVYLKGVRDRFSSGIVAHEVDTNEAVE